MNEITPPGPNANEEEIKAYQEKLWEKALNSPDRKSRLSIKIMTAIQSEYDVFNMKGMSILGTLNDLIDVMSAMAKVSGGLISIYELPDDVQDDFIMTYEAAIRMEIESYKEHMAKVQRRMGRGPKKD